MLFWVTLFVALIKGWAILLIISKIITMLPTKMAGWAMNAYLHPFVLFLIQMVITWLISLFSGESAEAGMANLLSSIFLAPCFSYYAKYKYRALLTVK